MDERENMETDQWHFPGEPCRKCGLREIDYSENKNSILCSECREELIKYPFPKKMILAAVLVLVHVIVAMARTPGIIRMYQMYSQAEEQADGGDVYPAILNLQTVLESYPSSIPAAVSMTDIAMEHGYYDVATYALNNYLVGKEINDSTYARLMRYTDKLNRYYDTEDQVEQLYASAGEEMGQEVKEEDLDAVIEAMREKLLDMTEREDLDKGLLYYYLASLAVDEKDRMEYLEASVKADPLLGFPEVELGTYRRSIGDLEGARECYISVLENDRNNTAALRAMGILKMLEGDKESGLSDVRKAFELNPDEMFVRETLVIALMECGLKEEADSLLSQFEGEGIEFDDDFSTYLNGDVSLYDYYVGR